MANWGFSAIPTMQAKPPLPVSIPEEWQKANEALQAVQQPKNAEVSTATTRTTTKPVEQQNGTSNDYTNFGWPQQPTMYPAYPGYTGYPQSYGYYNYNFGYLMNNPPYYINPITPSTPLTSSLPSVPPSEEKLATTKEVHSENISVSSLIQPPPPPPPPPATPPATEASYFTNITSQAPNSGGIKFNLPKKKNTKTIYQTTRAYLQERMNNFRSNILTPQKETNVVNQGNQNVAAQKSVSSMPDEEWSESLKSYVARCFQKCQTNIDKDQVELILKGKLTKAINVGTLNAYDWDAEPLPSIHSDRLKQEQNQAAIFQKLQYLKNQDKKLTPDNSRNFHKSRANTYRSKSRSRSRSFSRSRSRSRSPPRKVFRKRKYSSSSDSSGDSRGSKKMFSSVIGPSDTRIAKHTPNNAVKNKKKRKKGKNVPFVVESEFCTDERLLKRAARFETKNGKSPKPNLLFTISNTPSFVGDDNSTEIEWDSVAVVGTCQDLEKPFLRLTGAVDPTGVRPEEVLSKSLTMVKKHWIENQDYHFACEQLKSIRQDLVVQCIRNKFTVQVYETHARIALEKGDHTEFNQCQSQLKVLYHEVKEGNRLEFTGYHILYTMYTENTIELKNIIAHLSYDEKQDEVVSHALKLAKACSSNNYSRFFKLYVSAPMMSSFIIDWFIERIRKATLKAIIKSFRPNVPISYIQSALAFPSAEECLAFLTKANLVFVDADLINCKESVGPLANF
ncbi:leukocyte receptor cluster member 8 homolog [Trichonephila inaurata madagascariensis]|uniref:Leukocyte receptor cluster member 8 homolog n=1 Tax=Trichonephila inaurata madagascariensis TaxID=2747483 RepID=A0A8X6YNB9_9ARAC|nr:leukocyte receptor cluster member 8 homolog [Trichonephila inaurata madagascariensis]